MHAAHLEIIHFYQYLEEIMLEQPFNSKAENKTIA